MALRGSITRMRTRLATCMTILSRSVSGSGRKFLDDHTQNSLQFPRLSKQQVSAILQADEASVEINHEAVLRFDNCRLAANNPIEDRHSEGYCNATDGYLFGIFDGHAGVANAQAVSERLFNYIAVNLLNPDLLSDFCERISHPKEELNLVNFLTHNTTYFNKEFSPLYRDAIVRYAHENLSGAVDWEVQFTMEGALQSAFERLDKDLEVEAFPASNTHKRVDSQLLAIALSGCCGTTAHIDGPHLHVANTGDCGAVLGTQNEDGSWEAKPLTTAHCVASKTERRRLNRLHPNEKGTVIKDGRLLGILEPTRAFGDLRFKLPANRLRETAQSLRTRRLTADDDGFLPNHYFEPPQYYYTPPYLTAQPEVEYHHLRPKDKFLILATDGLWNMFPNNDTKVVQLVADHMYGAQTIADFTLPKDKKLELGTLNESLKVRKTNITKRAADPNCATHLIRNAIGQTETGINHGKLSAMLTLPDNFVRYYRDDITVTVVYFDEVYLKGNL